MKIHLISLGCPKNLVDSEVITGLLAGAGHTFTSDLKSAGAVILNTCAFIGPSRLEAGKYIREISKYKNKNAVFIVTGCLPQIEKESLFKQFPSIDAIFGSADFTKIPAFLKNPERSSSFVTAPSFLYNSSYLRPVSTGSYAYLKIAEGCDNRCSYCMIPSIRGNYRERKIEDIVEEAKKISGSGIQELILVSQDTTCYGTRVYGRRMLHELIRKLAKIPSLKWIRILYTHPGHFYDELIDAIAETDKVCKYVDIPVQHTHDEILKRMNRPPGKTIFETIEKLRKKIPGITLRTTIMIGFPGETEKHFKKLIRDIKSLEFDWLGCFKYSRQKGTAAYDMAGHVPVKLKKERYSKIMELQQKITLLKNLKRVGGKYDVLIDAPGYGHTEFLAPEIDGKVLFECGKPNEFVKTQITAVENVYDFKSALLNTKIKH